MDFAWASSYPEIYKICTLFQLTDICTPLKYSYTQLTSILQQGPQCGLVALAMCMRGPQDNSQIIFESAKNKNYTYNGEMFSVIEMAKLAREHLPNCKIDIFNGDLNVECIQQFLLNGGLMLVPYDTDKDNSPGLFKGHKAHWAVICGGIVTADNYYVVARHGKAKNISIWNLTKLAESNKQLLEFSPDRKLQDLEYKLPEGGISGPMGLNQQSVLIKL